MKIDVILMEPENPGNVGAVARAMKNFSFTNLVLVNPVAKYESSEARKRAKHANDVIDNATIIKTTDLKEYDYLIGTTSKLGNDNNMPRVPMLPREFAKKVARLRRRKVGILFGRESSGLTNEETRICDFLVAIPTSKKYSALNLSHSVAILLYELSQTIGIESIGENYVPIPAKEKNVMMKMIKSVLDEIEFTTKEKRETQDYLWQKVIGKAMLSRREGFAVMGLFRKFSQYIEKTKKISEKSQKK